MPTPSCPLGYRLVPDGHIATIEHALMCRIADLERLLRDYPGGDHDASLVSQRDALVDALRAINPTLAVLWLERVSK